MDISPSVKKEESCATASCLQVHMCEHELRLELVCSHVLMWCDVSSKYDMQGSKAAEWQGFVKRTLWACTLGSRS